MPVYEYECTSCGQSFEKLQSVSARAPRTCPYCSKAGTVRRRVSAPAFHLKGSGWYVTDYAGKGKGAAKDDGASAGPGGDEKPAKSDGDGADKEAKTEKAAKPDKAAKAAKAKGGD